MATTSTWPTVKARLVALLENALPLAGVQVTYSHPGDAIEPESVYLGDMRGSSVVPVSRAGRAKRQEDYTIDVVVNVATDGTTAEAADQRAAVLAGAVEDVVAADLTLGLPDIFLAQLVEQVALPGFDDSRRGWATLMRLTIAVSARLS